MLNHVTNPNTKTHQNDPVMVEDNLHNIRVDTRPCVLETIRICSLSLGLRSRAIIDAAWVMAGIPVAEQHDGTCCIDSGIILEHGFPSPDLPRSGDNEFSRR